MDNGFLVIERVGAFQFGSYRVEERYLGGKEGFSWFQTIFIAEVTFMLVNKFLIISQREKNRDENIKGLLSPL